MQIKRQENQVVKISVFYKLLCTLQLLTEVTRCLISRCQESPFDFLIHFIISFFTITFLVESYTFLFSTPEQNNISHIYFTFESTRLDQMHSSQLASHLPLFPQSSFPGSFPLSS